MCLCLWKIHPVYFRSWVTDSQIIIHSTQWHASVQQYGSVIDDAHFWVKASQQRGCCQGKQITTVFAPRVCVHRKADQLLTVRSGTFRFVPRLKHVLEQWLLHECISSSLTLDSSVDLVCFVVFVFNYLHFSFMYLCALCAFVIITFYISDLRCKQSTYI